MEFPCKFFLKMYAPCLSWWWSWSNWYIYFKRTRMRRRIIHLEFNSSVLFWRRMSRFWRNIPKNRFKTFPIRWALSILMMCLYFLLSLALESTYMKGNHYLKWYSTCLRLTLLQFSNVAVYYIKYQSLLLSLKQSWIEL